MPLLRGQSLEDRLAKGPPLTLADVSRIGRDVARGLAAADTRMGHDNTVTQMLARRLDLPVPDLSPDYLAHRGVTPTIDESCDEAAATVAAFTGKSRAQVPDDFRAVPMGESGGGQ